MTAFDFNEHCDLSNAALTLATLYVASTDSTFSPANLDKLRERSAAGCRRTTELTSYGEWVALVDNALSPADFYVSPRQSLSSTAVLDGEIRDRSLRQLRRNWVQGLFATHLNEDHFQDRALFSYFSWHRQAIAFAADGNLWSALLLNAFADHFLEDSFAPGHLRTPRRELHDAAAMAMHDYYNRQGAQYYPLKLDELAELVTPASFTAMKDLFGHIQRPLRDHLLQLARDGLLMRGDGRLDENPDQRLIMTLTVARSITDILQAVSRRCAVNSMPTFEWQGYRRPTGHDYHLMTPLARTPYGEYRAEVSTGVLRFNPAFGLNVGSVSFHGSPLRSRWTAGAELILGGSPGRTWVDNALTPPQFALLGGYSYSAAAALKGHSASLRLVVPVTRLDLQLSLIGRRTWYREGQLRRAASGYGARFEMGFGLAFVGVGAEREYLFVDGALRPRTAATVTLTLVGRARWFGF